jgi:hypothetical protein
MRHHPSSVASIVLVSLALALIAAPSFGQNLIANGQFLTNLNGWTSFTDEGSAVWASAGALEAGSAAMTSTAADSGVFKAYLTQCVPVASGTSYVLSHRVRFSDTTSGFAETAIYWDKNSDCSSYVSGNGLATSSASPGTFLADSITVTAPANATAAYVQVGIDKASAGGSMSVSFDDISLVPSAAATAIIAGWIPVAVSTPGAFGSFFKTSVQLLNPNSSTSISGHFVFHPAGVSGSPADPTLGFSLGPLQTFAWNDIVAAMGQSGAGSLDVYSSQGAAAPVAITRIFNDGGSAGTTGFNEPMVHSYELTGGAGITVTGFLIGPADTSKFRMNIGVRTLDTPVSMTVTVTDGTGATQTTLTKNYPANFFEQKTSADFLGGFVLGNNNGIQITFTGGELILYGAVADDITNDPSAQFLPIIFAVS